MSNYTTITKAQFERGLFIIRDRIGGGKIGYIRSTIPENTKEYVYEIQTIFPEIVIKVYSTIDVRTNCSRNIGADAIRTLAYYRDKQLFHKATKTLRLKTWQNNLENKIKEIVSKIEAVPVCPICGALMIERNGRNGLFWGCSKYPVCTKTMNCK
jgi:hypothetical protein